MKNALSELLNVIDERLGPKLRELGVNAKPKRMTAGQVVAFEAADRHVPLEIMVQGSVLLPGTVLDLTNCIAYFERCEAIQVGDNGWTYYEHVTNASYRFMGDVDRDFEQVAAIIEKIGVVRHPSVENRVTKNKGLAMAYEAISDRLSFYGNFEVGCFSNGKTEALEFDDASGSKWRFEFANSRVKVMVDGKTAGLFDPADRYGMQDLITARIQQSPNLSGW
ncbi:hypothetical protein ELH93_28525 (plasmid) [Rhizobium leguminosarum]|uniref:hypothetical protein n=1 Tax=Rhizobium leguminosarum TaxID=384 RepID=UPI0010319777|nr:hypothetical protein [Rhizobium leguminosarum]TAY27675.1 hypothetical protein ELH93_28525 [Rhizobium leguminosarum]